MSNTITVRLPDDLADWLRKTAKKHSVSASEIVREQLQKARSCCLHSKFLHDAGKIDGPADLSTRKGFSRE
jgi:Arc/MetJ-type ribon-helix-helix transcriptional regulator